MRRLAIIGLGGWGRRLVDSVHGKSERALFTDAVVTRPEKSAAYAESRGIRLHASLDAMLANMSADAVVSSGPAHLHAPHALAALKAGRPVLAVKPLALSGAEAVELGEAAARAGVLLALGYNRCFYPNAFELRRRLKAGAFGELLHAEGDFCVDRYRHIKGGDWKADPAFAPAGSLADHMLYLAIEALGPMAQAQALAFSHHTDNALADVTAVMLRARADRSVLLTAIGTTPDYFRFTLFGTKGWAELRDERHFVFQPVDGPRETLLLDGWDVERAEVEAFVAALMGEDPFPLSVEQAVHSVFALEAIAKAAASGKVEKIG